LIAGNQQSDRLVTFAIDQSTGALTPVGEPVTLPRAVSVLFVPPPRSGGRPAR
jgi:6-phosphogluconolactonase (cycloisomerase 2 family)